MHSSQNGNREIRQIEDHRGYFEVLAHALIDRKLRRKLDAQDLVQVTFLSAYQNFASMDEPDDPVAVRKWIGQILRNKLADERKKFYSGKRSVNREYSDCLEMDRSMAGIEAMLAANDTSPSLAAMRVEQIAKLAESLSQLADDQREVVVNKYINNRTVAEIAALMERTPKSVAGLLFRGVANLRLLMTEDCNLPNA